MRRDAMGWAALLFAALLASCGSVHKITDTHKKAVDSTATVAHDTAYKTVQAARTDNVTLRDVDITIYTRPSEKVAVPKALENPAWFYTDANGRTGVIPELNDSEIYMPTPADSALAVAKTQPANRSVGFSKDFEFGGATQGNKANTVAADMVNRLGLAGNIAAVNIHIGVISDSATKDVKIDSGSAHTKAATDVKTATEHTTKDVKKTSPIWILYVVGPLGLLFLLFLILKRYKIL